MPLIKDIKLKTPSTKFKKQEYRPWDIKEENENFQSIEKIKSAKDKQEKVTSDHLAEAELNKIWRFLSNSKRAILNYLVTVSKEEDEGLILTDTVIISEMANCLLLPVNTVKTSLQNLKGESLIFNYEKKPGRGGFTRYRMQKDLYNFLKQKISTK